jgi:hypothetical protein
LSIRFQADNDLRFAIVRAVRRAEPAIDFASAFEAKLDGLGDPEVLDRAATEGRVLVTHDRRTMIGHFRTHLAKGKHSPGILMVSQRRTPIGPVVESILCVWALPDPGQLRDQAHYLPSLTRHVFTR